MSSGGPRPSHEAPGCSDRFVFSVLLLIKGRLFLRPFEPDGNSYHKACATPLMSSLVRGSTSSRATELAEHLSSERQEWAAKRQNQAKRLQEPAGGCTPPLAHT